MDIPPKPKMGDFPTRKEYQRVYYQWRWRHDPEYREATKARKRATRAKNPEHYRKKSREQYAKDVEHSRAGNRRRYHEDPEKWRKYHRDNRRKIQRENPAVLREYNRKQRANLTPEQRLARRDYARLYFHNMSPEQRQRLNEARRGRPLGPAELARRAFGKISGEVEQQVLDDNIEQHGQATCILCFSSIQIIKRSDWNLEHDMAPIRVIRENLDIDPNHVDNLGVSHPDCNKRKGDMTLDEWYKSDIGMQTIGVLK